jgi:hypothetical protein
MMEDVLKFLGSTKINAGMTIVLFILAWKWFAFRLTNIQNSIDDMNEEKRWTETCDEKHIAVDGRLTKLEGKVFK